MMYKKILVLISAFLILPITAFAVDEMQVSRYVTASQTLKYEQFDLLAQQIEVRMPQNMRTVNDAMNYLLSLSGYSLVAKDKMDKALKIVLGKPLPTIDRQIGPMTLRSALLVLVGPAFVLKNDPVNRTVNFKLKHQFVKIMNG